MSAHDEAMLVALSQTLADRYRVDRELGAKRFQAEIKVTANLRQPNVLPLFDSGSADGSLFYVMPHIDGESLRARMTHEPQMPVDDVRRIVGLLAAALDYAHTSGVVHRDVRDMKFKRGRSTPR